MYGIIFLFLAMFCHNPNHHAGAHQCQSGQVTTLDDPGDTGHVPPKPPVPPPPSNP